MVAPKAHWGVVTGLVLPTLPAPGRHAPGRMRGPLPAGGRGGGGGGGGAAGGRARHRHGGQGAAGGQAEQVTGARDIRSVTFIIAINI